MPDNFFIAGTDSQQSSRGSAMALELHPLRFELQILLSSLPWASKQTYRVSTLEILLSWLP